MWGDPPDAPWDDRNGGTMEPRDDAPTTGRRWLPWVAGVMVIVGAVVAVGVFGVHTLFIDDEVTEAGPTFASGAAAAPTTTVAPTAATEPPDEPASTPTTASPTGRVRTAST